MRLTPEKYVERLREISDSKYGFLKDMLALTNKQAESINEDGIEKLKDLINTKQSKIEQIDKIDEEFSVYYHNLKQALGVKSLDEAKNLRIAGVKELQDTIAGIMSLLSEISELEQQNNAKAKDVLNGLGDEIKKINEAKKVHSAYNPGYNMRPPSYYIDKKK